MKERERERASVGWKLNVCLYLHCGSLLHKYQHACAWCTSVFVGTVCQKEYEWNYNMLYVDHMRWGECLLFEPTREEARWKLNAGLYLHYVSMLHKYGAKIKIIHLSLIVTVHFHSCRWFCSV